MTCPRTCAKLALLPLAALLAAAGCTEKNPKPVATPPPIVEVATPIRRTVTDYEIFTARTQAVQSVDIKARVTGYLTKINFQDGAEIKENDVLFEIDNRPYKATLDKAKADLEYTKASLVKAQAFYDIGLQVAKQAKEAISQQELDKRKGERDEAAASVKQSQAQLEMAQLNFDWCTVQSPISGRINRHNVDVGNLVSQDTTVLTNIVSLKPTWAYFDVDENTFERVQKLVQEGKIKAHRNGGPPVEMALGADTAFTFRGNIDFIANQLDPHTGSIRMRAVFPNDDGLLLAGMFGRMRVPIGAAHEALLVLDSAVGTNQGQKYVLVVNDQDVVEYRAVDVGLVFDGLREIRSTRTVREPGPGGADVTKEIPVLKATDRVIVNGVQRARPNTKVDPRPVDMLTLLNEPAGGPPKAPKEKDQAK
jgi:RND family efflux transporter MFP subunit